jgi:hypothetical protein
VRQLNLYNPLLTRLWTKWKFQWGKASRGASCKPLLTCRALIWKYRKDPAKASPRCKVTLRLTLLGSGMALYGLLRVPIALRPDFLRDQPLSKASPRRKVTLGLTCPIWRWRCRNNWMGASRWGTNRPLLTCPVQHPIKSRSKASRWDMQYPLLTCSALKSRRACGRRCTSLHRLPPPSLWRPPNRSRLHLQSHRRGRS